MADQAKPNGNTQQQERPRKELEYELGVANRLIERLQTELGRERRNVVETEIRYKDLETIFINQQKEMNKETESTKVNAG